MSYLTPAFPFDPALIDAAFREASLGGASRREAALREAALREAAFREAALRDASRRDAGRTPHAHIPAIDDAPIVLGGVLRSGSPFLDLMPLDASPGATPPVDGMLFLPLPMEMQDEVLPEAIAPEIPFDRAAVQRACARAATRVEHVEATVTSDDGVAEHVCDVTGWLAAATVRELETLLQAGWAGDEAVDVAAALADDDPEVAEVLRHARRADAGVVVEIDGRAALAWLTRHRPAIAEVLDDVPDESLDDG